MAERLPIKHGVMMAEKGTDKRVDKAVPAKAEAKPPVKPESEAKEQKLPVTGYDPWKVLRYPHMAEKSMNMVETENKLVFIVDRKCRKSDVKEAVEKGFNVQVLSVNIEINRKGEKKAFVKLSPESDAVDIATGLGMV